MSDGTDQADLGEAHAADLEGERFRSPDLGLAFEVGEQIEGENGEPDRYPIEYPADGHTTEIDAERLHSMIQAGEVEIDL